MDNNHVNRDQQMHPDTTSGSGHTESLSPYIGPKWLVEERDACGVGFIANCENHASHELVEKALAALTCLEHRGGCSADRDSGDGAGLMTAIPWELLGQWFAEQRQRKGMPHIQQVGVGMVFLPQDLQVATEARQIIEKVLTEADLTVLGWRVVPVQADTLGIQARENQPQIEQIIVQSQRIGDELERQLYIVRRRINKALQKQINLLRWAEDLYICSFSNRTIVYKGMVRSAVLGDFYTDLKNPLYKSAFALYHRRFSTNTLPKWPLAQPMRLLGHNGEINTLLGNINWMMAREADLNHSVWKDQLDDLKPVVHLDNSDSATLDNVLELLVRSGRSPLEALMIMVPEAYQNQPALEKYPEIADFYEYYSGIQEPWDGPALLVFSDGKKVGATLDRNGLRPARYCLTYDGYIIVASEAGVVNLPETEIVEKGRLGPGQMIAVDLETHEVLKNWEIKQRIAQEKPYGEWLRTHRYEVHRLKPSVLTPQLEKQDLLQLSIAFGYTTEDVEMVIQPMASDGKEATFCMGDDIPLAVLSERPHLLYDYFKQRFAQVTNPPIDPLRESLVMSLKMVLGERGNLLEAKPEDAKRIQLESPILNEAELAALKDSGFEAAELSTLFAIASGPIGLEAAVRQLCIQAANAVRAGKKLLILSDRLNQHGESAQISAEFTYIPPLLAVGAVHHHLIRQGLRMKADLIVDTAQCWSTHHFACLIGYGASAVLPYLALETVRHWWSDPKTQQFMERGKIPSITLEKALLNYRKAIEAGILKILSKMGISLLSSYHGAQIFEAIGIGRKLLDLGFYGTTSRVGGLSISELAMEVLSFHQRAFPELTIKKLENFGFIQYRPGGEYHMNSPELAKALHKAVADQKYDHYETYKRYLEGRPVTALRDLLEFESDRPAVPLEEVEPVTEIVKRFATGGMSLGALSP
ncbi:MAG: glutamate synthase subunit alpha, partial [Chroococcidiopsidaceae cyanobacterium CP_BM_ER_R8_30]|nr:glutamate synthase subunit alpha [Chroococcidiopsidaceae cyanobacterium CP_BM_ER_R8_30]